MQLRLLNFSTLVQNMAASVQAASAQLLDLTIGSVLRAVLEANAAIALWMQWLILQLLQTTRAATSVGTDLDSWMGDFALMRLPAASATGIVTLSRITPGLAAFIPVGALVRTTDGTQDFAVVADATNSNYNADQNGFILASAAAGIDLPVRAVTPGAGGNVQAGAITLIATALAGVDAVSNAALMQNGMDAETDAAVRARFQEFLDTRSRATRRAIGYAIANVQQGLHYIVAENVDAAGNLYVGNFVVTVDDGSGIPSASLLASVGLAVEAVRPVGSTYTVQPPLVMNVDVSVVIAIAPDAKRANVSAAVGQAILSYMNALPIGAALPLSRIAQIAHDADLSVINASQVLLNNSPSDINPPANGVIKPGIVAVN